MQNFAVQLSPGEPVSAWIVTMFEPDRTCWCRAAEHKIPPANGKLMCYLFTWHAFNHSSLCSNSARKQTNKQKSLSVRPLGFRSSQSNSSVVTGLPKISLNATRLTLSRTKSRRRGSRLGVRRRIQKVLVAGILAVDSVPSISDGPK